MSLEGKIGELKRTYLMDIRFVSSLTPDDEDRLAQVLVQIVSSILGRLSIAYAIRIRTTAGTEVVESSG